MIEKLKSCKRKDSKQSLCYTRDKAWMAFSRDADCVWLDAHGTLIFTSSQCRTLASWLNERAAEMEAK